jgi:hypothetical protein
VDLGQDVLAPGVSDVALGGEVAFGERAFDGADESAPTREAALAHDICGEVADAVRSRKKRSTRFSQELTDGVK